jgi:hypothetical protein
VDAAVANTVFGGVNVLEARRTSGESRSPLVSDDGFTALTMALSPAAP